MDDNHRTYRRQFLASTFKAGAVLAFGWTALAKRGLSQGEVMKQPDTAIFKDDGTIPNSRYPTLLYHGVINVGRTDPAAQVEEQFAANNWSNVISVRIAILVRSPEANSPDVDKRTYKLLLKTAGPFNDHYERSLFTTTIALRNRST